MKHVAPENLSIQDSPESDDVPAHALVVGEVLWDVFPDATRLGGAPLNFAVHFKQLGHIPRIVSAVGRDALGDAARAQITSLGLDPTCLQRVERLSTGTASVQLGPDDRTSFVIERPAAYDAVEISDAPCANRAVEAVLVLLRYSLRLARARPARASATARRAAGRPPLL